MSAAKGRVCAGDTNDQGRSVFMCNMSGVGGSTAQQVMLPASKGDVAGASGGGAVAGDLGSALSAINAALQQLVAAVQALTGNSALGGGAAKGGVEQLSSAPVQQYFPVQQSATAVAAEESHDAHNHEPAQSAKATIAQYGLGADTNNRVGEKTNVSNSKGDWKITYARPTENRTKAANSLATMMHSTAAYKDINAAKAAGYDFDKAIVEGTLVHVPNPTFSKQYGGADLNHPSMLLYRKGADGSLSLIGNVMTASKQAPDLGMGRWHTHQHAGSDTNTDLMMHVWFLPNDLDAAYSETIPKG